MRAIFANLNCDGVCHHVKERLGVTGVGSGSSANERTYHYFDHHAAIGGCKRAAAKSIYELRDDARDKEHGDAHGAQPIENPSRRKDDHAICMLTQ